MAGPQDTLRVALEAALGRPFADEALLIEALTHSSFFEGQPGTNNERLEFLGDRVLGLIAADYLLQHFPNMSEAQLAPRLNSVVNREACAKAARLAGLGPALLLSKAEANSGGREKTTILADAAEAIVAALYLHGGLEAARAFVLSHWQEALLATRDVRQDAKTALQEWAAAARHGPPVYVVTEQSGPDHAPRFVVQVEVAGAGNAQAAGGSKREAERHAASALLQMVRAHG